jgi:integrase
VTARRGNGEGSTPRPHPRGGFYVNITLAGKRVTIYGKTPAIVRQKVREAQRRAEDGQPIKDAKVTVTAWTERWITTTLAGSDQAQATRDLYAGLARKHVAAGALGNLEIGKVRKADVDGLYRDMKAAGYAGSTLRNVHAVLRALFREAEDNELIKASPMAKVARPAVGDQRVAFLTRAQADALVAALADDPLLLDLVKLLLLTGMRRGEALGLSWEQVGDEQIHVTQQLTRASDGLALRQLKTEGSARHLSITPPLAEVLRSRRRAAMEARMAAPAGTWVESGLVFTTALGGPLEPRNVLRRFAAAVARAELPATVHLHTLRHSAASFLIAAGVPMKVVQKILGHSSFTITADTYSHVAPELETEAMGKLGEALGW